MSTEKYVTLNKTNGLFSLGEDVFSEIIELFNAGKLNDAYHRLQSLLYSERLRSGFFVISIKGRNLIILHVHPGRQKVKN